MVTPAPGNYGAWIKWPGYGAGSAPVALQNRNIHPGVGGGTTGGAGGMSDYLWPINRAFNPNFNGVIYVNGSVAVSGVVRSQVTLAASGNILLADDLTYVTAPGSVPDCNSNGAVSADMLGLLTAQFFVIEDNNLNTPFQAGAAAYVKGFDETADETIHGAVLTLHSVHVRGYSQRARCHGGLRRKPGGPGLLQHGGSCDPGEKRRPYVRLGRRCYWLEPAVDL